MSLDETHAFLAAGRVVAACDAVLREIGTARAKIDRGFIAERGSIGPDLAVITGLHRQAEFDRLTELKALAEAAGAIDKAFTVQVSLGDFSLIRRVYARP